MGVHRTTISRMVKNQGAPANENGTIDLPVFFLWLRERDLQDNAPVDDEGMKYLNLFRKERFLIKRMERQQMEGELVSKEFMYKEWAKRLFTLRSGVTLWADRLSPRIEGKTRDEIKQIFDDEIFILFKTFSEVGRYCPEIDGPVRLND